MALYAIWTDADLAAADLVGPWSEMTVASSGLAFVVSGESLSTVYHEVKWSLPDGAALMVAPVAARPKAKGLTAGTNSWLRQHS